MSKRKGSALEAKTIAKKEPRITRSNEEEQTDNEHFIEITTKGKQILPTNTSKYSGSINKRSTGGYQVRFALKEYKGSKTFKSEIDAEAYKMEVNLRENLVKNIIYEYNNEYYCVLTQKKLMKFSIEDYNVVEEHTWYAALDHSFYAATTVENGEGCNKRILFHQFILTDMDNNESCDHGNRDSLDNTRRNLRPATKRTQSINRGIPSTNTSGVKGVGCYYDSEGMPIRWYTTWHDENGKANRKYFPVSTFGDKARDEAIAYRKNIEQSLPHYKEALSHVLK
jgi:hypothetical protein